MGTGDSRDFVDQQRLLKLVEDLQQLRDALVRLSGALQEHHFALAQQSGNLPALDLARLLNEPEPGPGVPTPQGDTTRH